jgi:hypothetical protein
MKKNRGVGGVDGAVIGGAIFENLRKSGVPRVQGVIYTTG